MSKELQVHPKVVKSRIKDLFDSGVIKEIRFYADSKFVPWGRYFILSSSYSGFPQELCTHFPELPFVERVIYGTLKLVNFSDDGDEVTTERDFSSVSLIAADESDMKKKRQLLESKLTKRLDVMQVINESPQKAKVISLSEHSILNAVLCQDPMTMSISHIAQNLGIPGRTVRRKVERLLENGVIYEEVSLDTTSARGVLLPSIIMVGDCHKWLPAIFKSKFLGERLLLYKNWASFSFFIFYAETFSVIDNLILEVKAIDPASMITYRNGSLNNPYVNYPSR